MKNLNTLKLSERVSRRLRLGFSICGITALPASKIKDASETIVEATVHAREVEESMAESSEFIPKSFIKTLGINSQWKSKMDAQLVGALFVIVCALLMVFAFWLVKFLWKRFSLKK